MPSILFWSGQPGGTAEYRCFGPGRALQRLGWDVAWDEDGIDVTPGGRVKGDPDVLVLCRIMGDYVPDAVRRIRKAGRTLVVIDTDDWFGGVPDYNPASRLPAAYVDTMHQAMRDAHLVTVSTPELAEAYGHLNRTIVLPNYLDPDIWADTEKWRRPRAHVVVGWAGAFHWRGGDLELLKPWIGRFLDERPHVRFAAIGCRELLEWLGVDGLTTPQLPSNTGPLSKNLHPYPHLPAMLSTLDVGLVPLTYSRFNQAKSWCKGMEYNAAGVPFAASPSREYRTFVQPGVNGLLVRRNEWARTVDSIIDDLDRYQQNARSIAQGYVIDRHINRWVDAYSRSLVSA